MSEHENVTIKHSSDDSSDLRQLVKDLSDLKFELETQKEELIRSRAETKESLELYENLYDYAPVGYLTLAKKKNKILRANLTAAKIFGVDRTNILGDFFDRFIGVEYLSVFYAMLERAFTNRKPVGDVRLDGCGFYRRRLLPRLRSPRARRGSVCPAPTRRGQRSEASRGQV